MSPRRPATPGGAPRRPRASSPRSPAAPEPAPPWLERPTGRGADADPLERARLALLPEYTRTYPRVGASLFFDLPTLRSPRVVWSAELPPCRIRSSALGIACRDNRSIRVLEPGTGALRWEAPLRRRDPGELTLLGLLAIVGPAGQERVFDVDTGALRWQGARRAREHARAWAPGICVRFTRGNWLEADVMAQPWRYPAEGPLDRALEGGTELTITRDAVVLWGSEAFAVLERESGRERFRGVASTVAADDSGLATFGPRGELAVIDPAGRTLWSDPGERGQSLAALAPDFVVVRRGREHAVLDRRTGQPIGALPPGAFVQAVVRDQIVFAAPETGRRGVTASVVACSPRGEEQWRVSVPEDARLASIEPLPEGLVLLLDTSPWSSTRGALVLRFGEDLATDSEAPPRRR